jgi:hypothetical protein
MKLQIMQIFKSSVTLSFLLPTKHSPQHLVLKHSQSAGLNLFNERDKVSHL